MEIRRSGARRHQNDDVLVTERPPQLRWDIDRLLIEVRGVPDVHKPNELYNYDIALSMRDIALLLGVVSREGIQEDPSEIQRELQGSAADLLRLLNCSAGIVPGPLPAAKAKE